MQTCVSKALGLDNAGWNAVYCILQDRREVGKNRPVDMETLKVSYFAQ
jgi:hypothetical protein